MLSYDKILLYSIIFTKHRIKMQLYNLSLFLSLYSFIFTFPLSPPLSSFIPLYPSPFHSTFLFLSLFILSSSSSSSVLSTETENLSPRNQTLRPLEELNKLKAINQHLRKINKPSVKTIHVSEIIFFFPLLYKFKTLSLYSGFLLCFRS